VSEFTIDSLTVDEAVREIDCEGKHLTDWEAEFIDGMIKQAERGGEPTRRQFDIVQRIYNDRVLRHRR
jgi:hypothetical protein